MEEADEKELKFPSDIYIEEQSVSNFKQDDNENNKSNASYFNNKEFDLGPSMNLYKTFDPLKPDYKDFLKDFEKNNWVEEYLESCLLILAEIDKLMRETNYTNCQIAGVFEIFYSCFRYLEMFPLTEENKFLKYFRQSLLLYTVNDPPECLRIFNAVQSFDVAKMFHRKVVMKFEMLKGILFLKESHQ